jgi:membrane-bound lytic murein transglycosylase D
MRRIFCGLALAAALVSQVAAQSAPGTALPSDTLAAIRSVDVMDSLLMAYQTSLRYTQRVDVEKLNTYRFAPGEVPRYSGEVYAQRLRELCAVIPLDYNAHVHRFIEAYLCKPHLRDLTSRLIGLKYVYFPMIEEIFDREGIPDELKYLCVIESAFNTRARSHAAAVGLWQFMPGTAKQLNARIDSYIDERQDPVKSTLLAARYLKQLYGIYGDWHLVIAAYNCGPGRINRALRLSGKSTYWEIMNYLPLETRGYVPSYIAATYALNYWREHNVYPEWHDFTFDQDTLSVAGRELSLTQLAAAAKVDAQLLQDLNPELRIGRVPYSSKPYVLRVPKRVADLAMSQRDSLFKPVAVPPSALETTYAQVPPDARLIWHRVRPNETYALIARRYSIATENLMAWNGATTPALEMGQLVKVFIAPRPVAAARPALPSPPGATRAYRVQSGDTLWDIAQRSKTTVEQLRALNGLGYSARLMPGMLLKVPN